MADAYWINRLLGIAGAGTILGLTVLTVRADAIDGSWCNAVGDNLQINGPAIVTPGGRSMSGDHSRHAFSYVSPEGEKFQGEKLDMILRSDNLMSMRLPDGKMQQWRRCEVVS